MAIARIGKIQLYYETHGEGIPLVLIAGLASDSQSWQPVMDDLAARHHVIAPDNRGVGRTVAKGDTDVSISRIADDCIELIRHLGLKSVNLLGHSMGGFVALDMAMRYPDLVRKLVLVGTSRSNSARNNALFSDWARELASAKSPQAWFRNIFYWIFSRRFFEQAGNLREALQFAVDYPYPQSAIGFEKQVNAIAAYDAIGDLSRINAKTLVIGGKEDILFPPAVIADLARAIPGASLSMIDKAAHSIHMEQPREFTRCVLDFLQDS